MPQTQRPQKALSNRVLLHWKFKLLQQQLQGGFNSSQLNKIIKTFTWRLTYFYCSPSKAEESECLNPQSVTTSSSLTGSSPADSQATSSTCSLSTEEPSSNITADLVRWGFIWGSIVLFLFCFCTWLPIGFLILPPPRGQENSAMQRSAKGWPRTHHQHKHPPPPLPPRHPFNPCKSSRSTRSRSSAPTPSVKQTDHRRPETGVPCVNRCSLSEEQTHMQNMEARGWRFRSTRDAGIPPSRGPDAVAKNRTFPPAHQSDPMDKGVCRTPTSSVMKLCIYDLHI